MHLKLNYHIKVTGCLSVRLSVSPFMCFNQKNLLTSEPISRNVWNKSWRLRFKVLLLSLLLYLCANNLRYTSGILRDKTMDIEIMYTSTDKNWWKNLVCTTHSRFNITPQSLWPTNDIHFYKTLGTKINSIVMSHTYLPG